jgi:serine phosphatase RsbU (regulator of sigma subunit)/pSer/pThr/pTyr-binding forkhead associated (FHA) protein
MSGVQNTPSLVLEPLSGPPVERIVISPDAECILGRGLDCTIQLPEEAGTVSRRHCRVNYLAGHWFITDLGSRHGTYLNTDRLSRDEPRRVARGDRVRIGPWVFRVQGYGETAFSTVSTQETDPSSEQLVTVAETGRENIHRRRLELLLDCAKRIAAASDESALANAVLDALIEGTGYTLVAVIRPGADTSHIEVLGSRTGGRAEGTTFSRSLISAAFGGQVVRLRRESMGSSPRTVISSSIQTALCVPVLMDRQVALCLYLDSRENDEPVHDDAAAFCQAVADMCAMCLSNIRRSRLEIEAAQIGAQLAAAKSIQSQIMGPDLGRLGRVTYSRQVHPGQGVAGDIFDVFRVDDVHVGFFVGDVAGKGIPASLLMAMVQSGLSVSLRHTCDPEDAVRRVNEHLFRTVPEDKFVSLWLGVINTRSGLLRFIDAGHGYALIRRPGHKVRPIDSIGGLPLRVREDEQYRAETIMLQPGDRVYLYSDGLVEQRGPSGEEFGVGRVLATLESERPAEEELQALMSAVRMHAGPVGAAGLADDVTLVAITYEG